MLARGLPGQAGPVLDMTVRVIEGDMLAILPTLDADSVDAVVTDPPYGLKFMGKKWDHGVPGVPFWLEVLRVLKFLDPFAGSGTTGMAAMAEGFNALLIDQDPKSIADIRRRIAHVHGHDTPLFAT